MKCLCTLLLPLLANAAVAAPLCDDACELRITFPAGGAIDAVEPLSISFGAGGVINDGAVTTGYADGETLTLNTGQSLTFAAGGSLDLGTGGNLDTTDFQVNSSGELYIKAVGGAAAVHLNNLTLVGGVYFRLEAGSLEVTGDIRLDTGDWPDAEHWDVCSAEYNPVGAIATGQGLTTIEFMLDCIPPVSDILEIDLSWLAGSVSLGPVDTGGTIPIIDTIDPVADTITRVSGEFVPAVTVPVVEPVTDGAPTDDDTDNSPKGDDSGSGAFGLNMLFLIAISVGVSCILRKAPV